MKPKDDFSTYSNSKSSSFEDDIKEVLLDLFHRDDNHITAYVRIKSIVERDYVKKDKLMTFKSKEGNIIGFTDLIEKQKVLNAFRKSVKEINERLKEIRFKESKFERLDELAVTYSKIFNVSVDEAKKELNISPRQP